MTDTLDTAFLHFKNGLMTITAKGWEFTSGPAPKDKNITTGRHVYQGLGTLNWFSDSAHRNISPGPAGVFADFLRKISGSDPEKFDKLCRIIGYLLHNYHDYPLKAINFHDKQDSPDNWQGASGKSLLKNLIFSVCNIATIYGKDVKLSNKYWYRIAYQSTQVICVDDVATRGRSALNFEYLFNAITEGAIVKKPYEEAFLLPCKFMLISKDPVEAKGASALSRIEHFEFSDYFSFDHTPRDEYGIRLPLDFDGLQWSLFHDTICYCLSRFLKSGL